MKRIFLILATILLAWGCKEKTAPKPVTKNDLIAMNERLVRRDSVIITRYCHEQGLDSVPNAEGLWITVLEEGTNEAIQTGSAVAYSYKISDIRGQEYYNGQRQITVGAGQDVFGVELALKQLHDKSKATIVLMPDLAYGLIGDENKIVGRKILRYDIEVLEVNR